MIHRDQSNRSHRAAIIAARLCLVFSLWQAPVPWLHCHDTDPLRVDSSSVSQDLSRHLAQFHSSVDSSPDDQLGWHYHWVLPSWTHPARETSNDKAPVPRAVEVVSATLALTVFGWNPLFDHISGTSRIRSSSRERLPKVPRSDPASVSEKAKTISVMRC